jgi:protein tyrosine phosphatase
MMNYNEQNTNIFLQCAQSRWYDYLYLIIDGAKSIVQDLLSGINVIVHCSDGWDRTSQLCSLSQLIMDPYYRTI